MGPSPWSRWSLSPPPRTVSFVTELSPDQCRRRLEDPGGSGDQPSGQTRQGVAHFVQGNRLWLIRQPRGYSSFWREFRGEVVPGPRAGNRSQGEIVLKPCR